MTGRGDPQACETSRLPYYLYNKVTDGVEVVSLTLWLTLPLPKEDFWYSFLIEAESTPGPSTLGTQGTYLWVRE
jgi:hypothetical protein